MKTAILFDLDGTLLNTLDDLKNSVNYALEACGYPTRTLEEIRRFVGNGAENLIFQSVPEGEQGNVPQVLAQFRQHYALHSNDLTAPYPGIPEALAQLGEKYPMAVVSNKPDKAVKELGRIYFPTLFALGETTEYPRKPAPDMLLAAQRELGADRFIYVGDSEVDVITAKNAGVPCLSVLWGFRDRDEIEKVGGTHFCEKVADLPRILEEMIHDLTAE